MPRAAPIPQVKSTRAIRHARKAPNTSLLAVAISGAITIFFVVAGSEQFSHWFVIPVAICGALVMPDMLNMLAGRTSAWEPAALASLVGTHVLFLAPLLHVYWDSWMAYVSPPDDWRTWIGSMAALNAVGLFLYRATRRMVLKPATARRDRGGIALVLDPGRFYVTALVAMGIALVTQILVYTRFGGMVHLITQFGTENQSFAGYGWIFVVAECFPILLTMMFAVYARQHPNLRALPVVATFLVILVLAHLFFGGFRGFRGNIVYGMFWAVGIIHLVVRPIPKSYYLVLGAFGLVFMYFYGFYKVGGLAAIQTLSEGNTETELSYLQEQTGKSVDRLLLADLGRSDVQAYLLYHIAGMPGYYQLAWGRTYYLAWAPIIPRSLWPDRPRGKAEWGTRALYGRSHWEQGAWIATNAYGLGGEAVLNFGALGVPLAFAVWGLAVGAVQRRLYLKNLQLPLALFLPLLTLLCMMALVWDVENLLFFFVHKGAIPLLVILAASSRRRVPANGHTTSNGRARNGAHASTVAQGANETPR